MINKGNVLVKKILAAVTVFILLFSVSLSVVAAYDNAEDNDMFLKSKIELTSEEQSYIKEHPTVVMAVDASWRPLEYVDDDNNYAGVIAEIVSSIESYTGLKIEYDLKNSYTEALMAAHSGAADLISGLANDENMADEYNLNLSEPYLTINSAVISNKELNNLYNESAGKRIAVVAGDYANGDIKTRISNSVLVECDSNEECLKKIKNKEVDMAIIASYCSEYFLSIPQYSSFHNHLLPDFSWELAFGVSRKADPILVSILNKGIGKLSQVDINEAVYKGIMQAEYDNDLLVFIYKYPLAVIGGICGIVFVIAILIFIILNSKKKANMRQIQDGTRLKLALERTHLCIWMLDIETRSITKIDNEHEKHGFYELRENIPQSVIDNGYIHPDDVEKVQDVLKRVFMGEQDVQGCWRIREKTEGSGDSVYWWEQVLFHIVCDERNRPVKAIGVSEDVTTEKNAQRDSLTSVFNRNSFEEKTSSILKERRNSYLKCAFLILDLDGFKQINDTYGHGMGDRVLISVGATLNKTFRQADIVGRLGGDEFTVFMASISNANDAVKKANQLVNNIRQISKNEDYPFDISCSVGISIGSRGRDDFSAMYKNADEALYEAKRAGKNRYMLYHSSDRNKILIVDDIEINREIIKNTLKAEYDVLEASNGLEALKVLDENADVNMVITDVVMPKMNGIELIKKIRSSSKYSEVAIIAETQNDDMKLENEILAIGGDDFIYKAASPSVIQVRVKNIMRAKGF